MEEIPGIAKKKVEEKLPKTFTELFPKDKIQANKWISFCKKIELVKNTKFKLDLFQKK